MNLRLSRQYWFGLLFTTYCAVVQSAPTHWTVTNKTAGISYNTQTQKTTIKGVSEKGLMGLSFRGEHSLATRWLPGAYRPTIDFDGKVLVDGYDTFDVSRIGSFRFLKTGEFAFIRTQKGPKSRVKLIINDHVAKSWPRLSRIKLLSFEPHKVILSVYDEKTQTTSFQQLKRNGNNTLTDSPRTLGSITKCSILSSKVMTQGIVLQTYCSDTRGSDVQYLRYSNGDVSAISTSSLHEAMGLPMSKSDKRFHKKQGQDAFTLIKVSGSHSGMYLYHAIYGAISKLLGEPMSFASDEAGKQSWSQSYRTLTLAQLYKKTGHPVFASLANNAMHATLMQQNKYLDIVGEQNPSCGWASRIYSEDNFTPVSFMINQAMIANSLIYSCKTLGASCSDALSEAIDTNASCLVNSYEKNFVNDQGLYRIPYASNFRYDGIWSPWNWQVTWAAVLNHVAQSNQNKRFAHRAKHIINAFTDSWVITSETSPRALWHYWTPQYYKGWKVEDKISLHRPKQKPLALSTQRYEDLNHAGISLLGLSFIDYPLSPNKTTAIGNTIDSLLATGTILPRDMDGQGPKNPRWSLGAGWHAYATTQLESHYTHQLPSSVSTNKHLTYALLAEPSAPFSLTIENQVCTAVQCTEKAIWTWTSIDEFLADNPLFSFTKIENKLNI